MTSTLYTRRAMLGGSALMALGALLAACGQQAANEASAPASSTATPSETASASAAATGSPSATPSTVRGYSGGSKAPDGEYREADPNGPAQNVPKPASPEDGYREKSNEGLRKTLNAWIEWNNYGAQTGDYSQARKFVDSSFTELLDSYEGLEALYKRGGWVIDGIDQWLPEGDPWSDDGETYFWRIYREWTRVVHVENTGKWEAWTNNDKPDDTFTFEMKHNGQKWEIINYI